VLKLAAAADDTPAAKRGRLTAEEEEAASRVDNATAFGLGGVALGLAGLVMALLAYRRAARPAPDAGAGAGKAE
jgi:hypothetical protein